MVRKAGNSLTIGRNATCYRVVRTAIALALATIAAACAKSLPDTETGAAILQPFKVELKQALEAGLAEGPAEAIDVCRVRAPRIAASLSTNGVRLGRTSHKLRNPENIAPAWANDILNTYLEDAAARKPVAVRLADGRVGHAEPIIVQSLCLVCHGEAPAPHIAEAIAGAYPEDRATGFRVGDLRGIFWVEYPERP